MNTTKFTINPDPTHDILTILDSELKRIISTLHDIPSLPPEQQSQLATYTFYSVAYSILRIPHTYPSNFNSAVAQNTISALHQLIEDPFIVHPKMKIPLSNALSLAKLHSTYSPNNTSPVIHNPQVLHQILSAHTCPHCLKLRLKP